MIISAIHWTSAPGGCNWTSVTHYTKLDGPTPLNLTQIDPDSRIYAEPDVAKPWDRTT